MYCIYTHIILYVLNTLLFEVKEEDQWAYIETEQANERER